MLNDQRPTKSFSALASIQATVDAASVRWFIFGLGFIVAVSSAVDQVARYGPHRLPRRRARESLKAEGAKYLFGIDRYAGRTQQESFAEFALKVEGILGSFNDAYNCTIVDQPGPSTDERTENESKPGGQPVPRERARAGAET